MNPLVGRLFGSVYEVLANGGIGHPAITAARKQDIHDCITDLYEVRLY